MSRRLSRVAAVFDVHGNLPALEAVLEEIRREDVDLLVVGGDVVPGPMPCESIDALLAFDIPVRFLRGNGELAVLARRAGTPWRRLPPVAETAIEWTARELRPEHEAALAGWPRLQRMAIEGVGDVLFCHATPRDEDECFTRRTPAERLEPMFAGVDAPIVVCGHTHMPFDRVVSGVRVVNAGSVGMPFGEPGADWLLLGPDVHPRRTCYDLRLAAERIRATSYPQADAFAASSVLEPPTEAAMLEVFAKAELALETTRD